MWRHFWLQTGSVRWRSMLTSLSDMMGRSRHSVEQAMERTRKNIVHHRRRFKLNCTAWICCVFILNASTRSSAQLRQCTEVRDYSYSCFFLPYLHCVLSICPVHVFVLHVCWGFKAFVVVWLTFFCTFGISLFIAYVQQDVVLSHLITKVTGASGTQDWMAVWELGCFVYIYEKWKMWLINI